MIDAGPRLPTARAGRRAHRVVPARIGASALAASALALVLLVIALPSSASAATSPPPRGFVGLQDWVNPDAAGFARLNRGRIPTWRTNITWSSVERREGTYDWTRYDALFEQAAAARVRVLPVLIGSPSWVAKKPQWPPVSAEHKAAFRRFSAAAVARYGPSGSFWVGRRHDSWVRAWWWQVWNEPNHTSWWTNGRPSARAYASMLIDIGGTVKRTDSRAKVISAGLPQSVLRTRCAALCITKFLTDVFEVRGAARAVDAVAVHTYSRDTADVLERMDYARAAMRKFRDARDKHLWITEMGWATGGSHPAFSTTFRGQARRLDDAYRTLLAVRSRYKLLGAVWFNLRDPHQSTDWQRNTGLFDWRGRPKPAWPTLLKITGGR